MLDKLLIHINEIIVKYKYKSFKLKLRSSVKSIIQMPILFLTYCEL